MNIQTTLESPWFWVLAAVGFVVFFKASVSIAAWWMARNEPRFVRARREERSRRRASGT